MSKIEKNSINHNPFHVGERNHVNFSPQTNKFQGLILNNPKCAFSESRRNSIRHVVLGYGFRGHSPFVVATTGIATASRTCGAGALTLGSAPYFV